MYKIGILTIGDEVRIGQVVNTNAAWLSVQLTGTGAFISEHRTIGDDREIMLREIDDLFKKNDLLITTGGLGPTHDDITKPVLLEYFNDKLIFSQDVYNSLLNYLKIHNRELTDLVKNQAMIPSKSLPLENKVGTAPGLLFQKNGKALIALPGVPAEVKYITTNHIIPFVIKEINNLKCEVILYKTFITAGAFESELAEKIGNINEFLGNSSLAFLPSYQGVRLRIGAKGNTFEEAKIEIDRLSRILYDKVGQYIVSEDDKSLSQIVGEKLKDKNQTVAVAESCTGGLLGKEFTDIPGSSAYFLGGIISYSNEAKVKFLNVNKKTLDEFGAVSEQTAYEMAMNVRNIFNADYGISITGIAGPDGGTPLKPVGTVWIGISTQDNTFAKLYHFGEFREVNRERSVGMALTLLLEAINSN
ncbi:MAG TPA: competence/damage-inducible protein A [Bacteroidota bacterium]|nr:competence/damage-inducible protein A [Bacteroidota bacterium]